MSGQRVGVVGDAELAAAVETAVEAVGGTAVDGATDEAALVVAGGEAALVDVARRGVDAPVLPVGGGDGVGSVAGDDAEAAVRRVLDGEYETTRHPVVTVEGAAGGATIASAAALFDVALVAAEPARISEFAVRAGGERVARFRADGVVASTPAGSVGYNRAAGGPVVAPETDVVAVVPIAPFATHADRWVLPLDDVTLSVERDETPVELLVDGRTEATVAAADPVTLSRGADLRTVIVPESEPFF